MMKRIVLLNPGPVNVSDRVRNSLLKGDLCHREEEFSSLMKSIRGKLLKAFHVERDYTAVLISGSGTAALEMGVVSCLSPGRSILIIQNGVYGERIAQITEAYNLNKVVLNYGWGEPPSPDDIEKALKEHSEIEVVAMVHHETTTGLLNPLNQIGELARRYKKKYFIDCISSLAGDDIDFDTSRPDFVIGTANKCIQGLPGVSFVLFRKTDLCRLKTIPARSLYFNLFRYHTAQESGDILFTPAVQAHYAMDEALDELIEETVEARIHRYRSAAELLRKCFAEIGLEFIIPESLRSNGLTALKLPEGMSYSRLHDRLKENGFVIYAGQGIFSDKIFRIANMGDIRTEEFQRFTEVLKESFAASTHKR